MNAFYILRVDGMEISFSKGGYGRALTDCPLNERTLLKIINLPYNTIQILVEGRNGQFFPLGMKDGDLQMLEVADLFIVDGNSIIHRDGQLMVRPDSNGYPYLHVGEKGDARLERV